MAIQDGGPAFPRPIGNNGAHDFRDREVSSEAEGMSLRDYFAGQVLLWLAKDLVATAAAQFAYEYADAMLTARKATDHDA